MLCERSLATAGLLSSRPSSEIFSPERQKRLGTSPSRSKGATIVSIKLFRLGLYHFEHIFEVTPHEDQYTMGPTDCQGGAEGIRTPDLRLAKAAFSQLNYGPSAIHDPFGVPLTKLHKTEWAFVDSNHRPSPYQRDALTS